MNTRTIPQHIAIIMDGNGRWAAKRHLPRVAGHRSGVKAAARIIEACSDKGIQALSLFAFSSENWSRPEKEVNALMDLFCRTLQKETENLQKHNVRLRFIGDRQRFNNELQKRMCEAELETAQNTGLICCIAMNYGGRWDIIQAAKRLAIQVQKGQLAPSDINEASFAHQLTTCQLPEPDLFIRTSGERRISNFFLWQLAYTECYFTDLFWPEFSVTHLEKALTFYASRERRFGSLYEEEGASVC